MKHLVSTLLCITLFAACLAGIDHLFLAVSVDVPGYSDAREFYLDFRSRLLTVSRGEEVRSIEKVITTQKGTPSGEIMKKGVDSERETRKSVLPKGDAKKEEVYSPGYVYADDEGTLHFTENLDEVPVRYRREAQPLEK